MYCHACAHYVLHTDKNYQKCFSKISLSAVYTTLIVGLSNFKFQLHFCGNKMYAVLCMVYIPLYVSA